MRVAPFLIAALMAFPAVSQAVAQTETKAPPVIIETEITIAPEVEVQEAEMPVEEMPIEEEVIDVMPTEAEMSANPVTPVTQDVEVPTPEPTASGVTPSDATVAVETPHGLYEEMGSAGDWTAIRFQPSAERTVCAIFTRPVDSTITEDGNVIAALRGERAAFITWEAGTVKEEGGVFSAMIGAPLATPFTGHSFTTEHGTFDLFGHDDRLYAQAESDAKAIEAIRRGMTLTVKANLPGGRIAQDSYSLKGVVAATKLAAGACPG